MNKRIRKKYFKKQLLHNKPWSIWSPTFARKISHKSINKWYHKHFTIRNNTTYRRFRTVICGKHPKMYLTYQFRLKNKAYIKQYNKIVNLYLRKRLEIVSFMHAAFTEKILSCKEIPPYIVLSKWGYNVELIYVKSITKHF